MTVPGELPAIHTFIKESHRLAGFLRHIFDLFFRGEIAPADFTFGDLELFLLIRPGNRPCVTGIHQVDSIGGANNETGTASNTSLQVNRERQSIRLGTAINFADGINPDYLCTNARA